MPQDNLCSGCRWIEFRTPIRMNKTQRMHGYTEQAITCMHTVLSSCHLRSQCTAGACVHGTMGSCIMQLTSGWAGVLRLEASNDVHDTTRCPTRSLTISRSFGMSLSTATRTGTFAIAGDGLLLDCACVCGTSVVETNRNHDSSGVCCPLVFVNQRTKSLRVQRTDYRQSTARHSAQETTHTHTLTTADRAAKKKWCPHPRHPFSKNIDR